MLFQFPLPLRPCGPTRPAPGSSTQSRAPSPTCPACPRLFRGTAPHRRRDESFPAPWSMDAVLPAVNTSLCTLQPSPSATSTPVPSSHPHLPTLHFFYSRAVFLLQTNCLHVRLHIDGFVMGKKSFLVLLLISIIVNRYSTLV